MRRWGVWGCVLLFWVIIKVSLHSLWSAKLRSFLAILGIIMGVGAVIAMLSIVEGARRRMQGLIGSLGTDVLYVWPDYRASRGKGAVARLSIMDAKAVLGAEDVVRVSPEIGASAVLKYGSKSVNVETNGVAPPFTTVRNMAFAKGRMFNDGEVNGVAHVVVLGSKTAEKLFGAKDPIDETIKLNMRAYRVVGVLESKGAQGWSNNDNLAMVPYTVLQREIMGRSVDVGSLCIQGSATERMKTAEDQIRVILRKMHKLKATDKDDFGIFNQGSLLEAQNKAMAVFAVVLGGIGGICLLTGGIGIMNIMLVIVTERTREIGLRKALGAKKMDILRQFLLESSLISVLGGVMGIMGGVGLSWLIKHFTELRTFVSVQSIMMSLTFALGIGIFFGFYPALRAARLHPIEALARE